MILDHLEAFRIKYCSSVTTTVFGLYTKELVGTSVLDFIDTEDIYDVQEELREIVRDEAVSNRINFAFVSHSGLKTEFQASVSYTDDGIILIAQVNPEEMLQSIGEIDLTWPK
ncbi:hypothetical protein K493DRAFT_302254 [Basidiobolus meristosporus CBS 931.73]|uniref:PAS domain-containing protein n=1 Tax=Basidiobolus meristosporus CBS 931.73 TaxID=1314790 RepID=A0A1Y1Y7Y0_9FUNG|nr:hypothetical protein K493DRAFT_302254 [Basidiobolus meristosporus CBS 931.73]|eukprot:ORX94132.1 hypothetical protein K493DRAFT_302254 [Basidiobolus meristosporus CBS 931.73]